MGSIMMMVLMSKKSRNQQKNCDWLEYFQDRVNEKIGYNNLQFTAKIWKPGAPASKIPQNKIVKVNHEEAFPYLDVEMYWRADKLKL